jgi:hypothetical protein
MKSSYTEIIYALINNPMSFTDVEAHWSKNAINDLASRMIIKGISKDKFEPDWEITRAEFVEILIQSLGPMRSEQGKKAFSDISKDEKYYDMVSIAYEYEMINGYGNGKFGPNDLLTREQAMVMIARSMKLTNPLIAQADPEATTLLGSFTDIDSVSAYAKQGIAACVKMGIVLGKSDMTIAPKDYITRAEIAVLVKRMLQNADLIK